MENVYFFTGFPGFISTSIIKNLVKSDYQVGHIYLLVLPQMVEKASQEILYATTKEELPESNFTIIPGDITKQGLGIPEEMQAELEISVTHVFHLAAIYDLAVPENIAQKVNVDGTRNINQWVLSLTKLERYIYFSTAYVSGDRQGVIYENELQMGQGFKNHYERTKYDAEVLVEEVKEKVPVTIIRPGVVRGDSKTGETIKFDGPYFILNVLDRLRYSPLLPYLASGEAEGNFVPIDYVLNGTIYLAHEKVGIGKTYHLTDPEPYKMNEVYKMLMNEYLGKTPKGALPLFLTKGFLSLSPMRKWIRVQKEAMDYFTCVSHYDCTQAQDDLQGSGISCPDFKDSLKSMVMYYDEYKNDRDKQLTII
ncbi:SDR family oxidoreductase [Pseudalkalibacillus caeni]|uniref:SDR family oxidoreductase n=1 Tax=Exobacillus caeni TaxID=2574798 RepID=A0A5R9F6L6_9BACL|nr:SDR family oxidoreductase [Pseudalkalibacillus caeni]TLS36134.1 SDR family oxidoreductase [Pseudalkalibacillus caeni]